MENTFYRAISAAIAARANCECSGRTEIADEWSDYIAYLMRTFAPSGSGFDSGTQLCSGRAKPDTALYFVTAFHHMDENGFYDGWTNHHVTIRPTFCGIDVRVSGRDRNGIKDYIAETFCALASQAVPTFGEWRTEQAKRQAA